MPGHSWTLALAFALAFGTLAGCVSPPPAAETPPPTPPAEPARSSVVIAVIDTGINLYHSEYRRDASVPLPPGMPDVPAVVLTLDAASFDKAVDADREALDKMEEKTLYRFPGTKVLGISFNGPSDWPVILDLPDTYAHGTMTTSRAAGNTVSIGGLDQDIWLVIVQGFSAESVRWAADQPWIDIVSISAGISPYSIIPGAPNALDEGGIEAYNHASHAKPFFASTGNGMANSGLAGFPAASRGSSGVPDAVSVGANDNDNISHWHNQGSYIAADGCNNPRASPRSFDEILMDGGGTSSATPFSAGGGAKLLLEARRILGDTQLGPRAGNTTPEPGAWSSGRAEDSQLVLASGTPAGKTGPLADGVFTLTEFKDVLYHTALVTPTDDESDGVRCDAQNNANGSGSPFGGTYVPASSVPEDGRFPFQGYGEVNAASIAAAVAVLNGTPLPERATDDEQYAAQREAKMQAVGDDE